MVCELRDLINEIKDIKATQNTRSKNPTTFLQLVIDFKFSSLSFLPNLVTSLKYTVDCWKFRTSQPSFLSILGL